jgi:hypothetical protein
MPRNLFIYSVYKHLGQKLEREILCSIPSLGGDIRSILHADIHIPSPVLHVRWREPHDQRGNLFRPEDERDVIQHFQCVT